MPRRRVPINRDVLRARVSYIEDSHRSLERFRGISFEEFHSNPDHFRIAFYDLHRSLEAVMDIGSHILSRIPGARPSSYKDIPQLLEKHKIIPSDFADGQLTKMAGYRNRMVHFYGEITEKEIYNIIQEELQDLDTFCGRSVPRKPYHVGGGEGRTYQIINHCREAPRCEREASLY